MLTRAKPLLGTLVTIRLFGHCASAEQRACTAAFAEIAEIHRLMSFHEPDSDLSRINREAAHRPVSVNPRTHEVLSAALELQLRSNGLFDCGVGAHLVALGRLPDHGVNGCRTRGFTARPAIVLEPNQRVRLSRPALLDLGGIAKGYAVDRAIDVLRDQGMSRGVVNAGGDLRVFGAEGYEIHLRRPNRPAATAHSLRLHDGAIATTGTYFDAAGPAGGADGPLIEPRSGRCVNHRGSVSVIAPSCLHADALTKVVWLSADVEHPILTAYGASALILDRMGRPVRAAA